jgi:hypothetical protein
MINDNPDAPFVERLTELPAILFTRVFVMQMAGKRMSADGALEMINNARQHYSAEALAQRAQNRVAYFDAKYPDDRKIILVQ